MSKKSSHLHLGVDLISLARIKKFLRQYSLRGIRRLLTLNEFRKAHSSKAKFLLLAQFFSAKEAYFKSLNRAWLGIEGFARIEITPLSSHHFEACWIEENGNKKWPAQGSWASVSQHIFAQVVRWE